MLFLLILVIATLIASVALVVRRRFAPRDAARSGMALAMAFAGVTHWLRPDPFVQHLPDLVPLREELVFATGGIEVALGAALLVYRPRRRAGILTAWYLVAVFPANVYVAVAGVDVEGQPDGPYAWLRLPLQVLFIGWCLWSTRDDARAAHREPLPTERDAAVSAPSERGQSMQS